MIRGGIMLMCRFVFLLSRIQSGCINKVFRGLRSDVSIAFVQSCFCRCFFFPFFLFGSRHLLRSNPFYADCHSLCSGTTNGRAGCKLFPPQDKRCWDSATLGNLLLSLDSVWIWECVCLALLHLQTKPSHSSFYLVILVGMRVSGKETHFAFRLWGLFAAIFALSLWVILVRWIRKA